MNTLGLYIGNPAGFAQAADGVVIGCGHQEFEVGSSQLSIIFARWVQAGNLLEYDRVALWSPKAIPPSVVPVYRWVIDQCGDKVITVSPREIRNHVQLDCPTRRDYLRTVRSRYESFHVKKVEEAIAILLIEAALGREGDHGQPDALHVP